MTIYSGRGYGNLHMHRGRTAVQENRQPASLLALGALYAIFLLATIGVNFRILSIGEFALTLAPFGAAALLAIYVRWGARFAVPGALAGFFLTLVVVYPLFTGLLNGATGSFDVPIENQVRTYLLWIVNAGLLTIAFYGPIRGNPILLAKICIAALVVILLFGILQSFVANVFKDTSLYNVFGDHFYFEKGVKPQRFERDGIYRAISLFYEPSFFGRTCVCLSAVALICGYRPMLALVLASTGVLLSMSAGSFILLVIVILLWTRGYSERRVSTGVILSIAAVAAAILIPFITVFVLQRIFQEVTTEGYNSGFVRVALPLEVLRDTLAASPFGAPLGANQLITANHPGFILFAANELKVTSGVYEMIMYTGVFGVIAALLLLYMIVTRFIAGAWRDALMIAIMLLGTIVSSSLLAFENTIQFLPIILAWRLVRNAPPQVRLPAAAPGRRPYR